jgi:hypothetical protein
MLGAVPEPDSGALDAARERLWSVVAGEMLAVSDTGIEEASAEGISAKNVGQNGEGEAERGATARRAVPAPELPAAVDRRNNQHGRRFPG